MYSTSVPKHRLFLLRALLLLCTIIGCAEKSGLCFPFGGPALRDFKWEAQADQVVFKVKFSHAPTVQAIDKLIEKRYFYVDFYREEGPTESANWDVNSPLVQKVCRIYYPAQKVLRFVFYIPHNSDVRFEKSTQSDYTCVVTARRIMPLALDLHEPAGAAPTHNGKMRKLVVIDPGHGGHLEDPVSSPGAFTSRRINGQRVYEKDVVLKIGLDLEQYIKRSPNLDCFMTRHDDTYVSLDQRIELANQSQGDLFLSIHLNADSSRHKTARGFEIYYLGDETKAADRALASLENDEHIKTSKNLSTDQKSDLQQIIRSLMNDKSREMQAQSRDLCMVVDQETLEHGLFRTYNRGVKSAGFRVLLNLNMPAALAECGFIDTPPEASLLVQDLVQKQIAALLFNGINRYFAKMDPKFEPHCVPVGS